MTTKKTFKGLVGFSRISGQKRLYMSNLNNQNWIQMKVYEAEDSNSYGEKRANTKSRHPLIELDLSAAQFAELLTTMNIGSGVPCTLNSFNGERINQDDLKNDKKPIAIGRDYFEKSVKEYTDKVKSSVAKYKEDLSTMKMSKKDKVRVENLLNGFQTEVSSNLPFYVEMFEEAAGKVVTESKSELDAFVSGGIVKAGLEALGLDGKALLEKSTVTQETKPYADGC